MKTIITVIAVFSSVSCLLAQTPVVQAPVPAVPAPVVATPAPAPIATAPSVPPVPTTAVAAAPAPVPVPVAVAPTVPTYTTGQMYRMPDGQLMLCGLVTTVTKTVAKKDTGSGNWFAKRGTDLLLGFGGGVAENAVNNKFAKGGIRGGFQTVNGQVAENRVDEKIKAHDEGKDQQVTYQRVLVPSAGLQVVIGTTYNQGGTMCTAEWIPCDRNGSPKL